MGWYCYSSELPAGEPLNNTIDEKNAFPLLLANHQHIHENIKFADQKAGFFVTLNGAALAFVYSLIKSANQKEGEAKRAQSDFGSFQGLSRRSCN
jgi:hypothetical protein